MTTFHGQTSYTTQVFYLPQQLRDIFSHKGSFPETFTCSKIYGCHKWSHPHLLITPHYLYIHFYNVSVHI